VSEGAVGLLAGAEMRRLREENARLWALLDDNPRNVEMVARVAAANWEGGPRVLAWHMLNALILRAKGAL
jgi:hypothetical protein